MAKKPTTLTLSFRDLVLGAETEILRAALVAREQIDTLLAERTAAYERIAELETQIEDVVGDPGVFPFPAPPQPVAGFDPKAETVTLTAPKKPAAPKPVPPPPAPKPAPLPSPEPAPETEAEAAPDDETDES